MRQFGVAKRMLLRRLFTVLLVTMLGVACGAEDPAAVKSRVAQPLPIVPAKPGSLYVAVFTACSSPRPPSETSPDCLAKDIEGALAGGLDFLESAQLEWGEFAAPMCDDPLILVNCLFRSSPFATTFILFALAGIDQPASQRMRTKAVAFLDSEERTSGWWPFWSTRSGIYIPGDVDTTAAVSFAIFQNGRSVDNRDLLMSNRTTDTGVFLTWFPEYVTYAENDVDCVVNANALLHLGEVPEVCAYLNEVIASGAQCSKYYPDELALAYVASRALHEGSDCLQPSADAMTAKALARLAQPQGSALETALALNTLLHLNYAGPETATAIRRLLDVQAADGSWAAEAFWCIDCGRALIQYFGSRELTTGFVLEALSRFAL